jgi:GNAT superfamily N-acetyltransferase
MTTGETVFRTATAADMPGIARVRTSVRENLLTREQMRARGITNESVAAAFLADSRGWVAERNGDIIAFAIADRAAGSLFALFVVPAYEGQGLGSRLLALALQWLSENGVRDVWLTTGPDTRAARFYERRGWTAVGPGEHEDVRYELSI